MVNVGDRIRGKLEAALTPSLLELVDESAAHAGHAGARPEGETHFKLHIVAAEFAGLGRLERQRLIHRILEDELAGPVHALSVVAEAPADTSS